MLHSGDYVRRASTGQIGWVVRGTRNGTAGVHFFSEPVVCTDNMAGYGPGIADKDRSRHLLSFEEVSEDDLDRMCIRKRDGEFVIEPVEEQTA